MNPGIRILPVRSYDPQAFFAEQEALYHEVGLRKSPATVQIATLNADVVSLGVSNATTGILRDGVPCVRRITGGNAVFHKGHEDLIISITYPIDGRFKPECSYDRLRNAVVEALQEVGITNAKKCGLNDIVIENQTLGKICGVAQRGKDNYAVLTHAALFCAKDSVRLWSEALTVNRQELEQKLVAVSTLTRASHSEISMRIIHHLTRSYTSTHAEISESERQRTTSLLKSKYFSQSKWNLGRGEWTKDGGVCATDIRDD